MALSLKRLGITRIRPLAGGIEEWRARAFPVEVVTSSPAQIVPAVEDGRRG